MRIFIFCVALIFIPFCVCAEQLSLTKDTEGWTVFTPSVDTDVVYVDSISGNDDTCTSYRTSSPEMGSDPFNPAGGVLPCATPAKAVTFMGANSPDWMLFKRGSVFSDGIAYSRSGRSVTEPTVISSYGNTGDLPVFKKGYANNGNVNTHYLAISGLSFYNTVRDPSSPDYSPDAVGAASTGLFLFSHPEYSQKAILIEGCRFRYFLNNIVVTSDGVKEGLTIRRNTILDSYSRLNGHSQGVSVGSVDGFLFEENILDHNGWKIQNDGDATDEIEEATMFNHNTYFTGSKNLSIKDNIYINSSSNQTKLRYHDTGDGVNILVDNNLYIGGEVAVSIGAPDEHENYSAVNPQVTNNVHIYPGYLDSTNRSVAWFSYNFNWDGGNVSNNLMLNQTDNTLAGRFFHLQYSGRNINIHGNVVYNVDGIVGLDIFPLDGTGTNPIRSGISIYDNIFDIVDALIADIQFPNVDGYSFYGNKYSSTKAVDTWFKFNDATKSNAQWIAETGDTSTFEQVAFTDSTRSISTYMSLIGETATTLDDFISLARSQTKYSWDDRIMASLVNAHIRVGFDMEAPDCTNTPSVCTTLNCVDNGWYLHSDDICRAYPEGSSPEGFVTSIRAGVNKVRVGSTPIVLQ